jgi:signal transduction histidine kinase
MFEFFRKLFASDFIPHGHCYLWRPEIISLHVISDGLTAFAYFLIPFALVHLIRKRRDLDFSWMFILFGIFIMACGTTHIMAIVTLWRPVYRLEGLIKAITALASVPTALLLVRLVPQAVSLPSPAQLRDANYALEKEVIDRKLAEEQVKTLNAKLEQRVVERTRELQDANEALRRMNDDLKHFSYAAAHDLQEPLRSVVTCNQLLKRNFEDQLPPAANRFIQFSIDSALRMRELVGGLSEYWQASERGEDDRTIVSCEDAVQGALKNLGSSISESGAEITVDPLPTIFGQPVMMIQLFQNLIGNAIKYRGDKPLRIHISAQREDANWQFAVADNGIGIAPSYHELIFGVFKRLHGRIHPGVGIGLALCRKVVERHGGRIWVDSAEGQGATFKFTMPANGASDSDARRSSDTVSL